jgi:hypothetical protein
MTEGMLRDHLWAQHDRLHLKKDSIGAKWRAKKKAAAIKVKEKAKEPIKPAFASVEKYQEEWAEEKTKEHFQARLDLIKRQVKRKELTSEQAKAKIAQLKADLQKANETITPPREASAPKPELQRKVRSARVFSSPTITPLAIPHIPSPRKTIYQKDIETPQPKSQLDELLEEMKSQQKVN